MLTYTRPTIEPETFRDAAGDAIEYGTRWRDGPPDDSYEVEEHLERFAPLHTVATALIEFLVSNYEVNVVEGEQVTDDLASDPRPGGIVRAVRLTPVAEGSAPLVIILTSFPGVHLYAGALFDTVFPSCGCNACDENWLESSIELEWQTLAIAGGGFTEYVSAPRRPKWSFDRKHGLVQGMGQTYFHQLRALDGSTGTSGESRAESFPAAVLEQAQISLEIVAQLNHNGNWNPWSLRNTKA